ncbi:unnamed protein product [Paramecium octaurelia]|uniref:Uncharacterized protein n=1 Tax=Paramecium octaurelia TaxID=43137 RepID=A0A8S1XEC9_PAROT|nr:unnamed protein product [Paramecium octaurelia]
MNSRFDLENKNNRLVRLRFRQTRNLNIKCWKQKVGFHKFIHHINLDKSRYRGIIHILEENDHYQTIYKEILHQFIEKMKKKILKHTLKNANTLNWEYINEEKVQLKEIRIQGNLARQLEYIEWHNKAISYEFMCFTTARMIMKDNTQNKKKQT